MTKSRFLSRLFWVLGVLVALLTIVCSNAGATAHAATTAVHSHAATSPIIIHTPLFRVNNVAWSPDSQRLAMGNFDGTLQTWKALDGSLLAIHADSIRSVYTRVLGWSGHSQDVISYGFHGARAIAERWDATTGKTLVTMGPEDDAGLVRLSPDGTRIAFTHYAGTIDIRDTSTGQLVRIIQSNSNIPGDALDWSPDGTRLASTNYDGSIETAEVWNALTGQHIATYYAPSNQSVQRLAWFPDGKHLISSTSSSPSIVQSWSAATGKVLFTYPLHPDYVDSLSLSPDGKGLALQVYNTIQLWNATTGKLLFTAGSYQTPVAGSAWSPGGKQIVLVGIGYPMQIRDTATGRVLRTYSHANGMEAVTWSPDGKSIATIVSGVGVVTWSASVDHRLVTLPARHQSENAVTWSPDGTQIAAEDGATYDVGFWNAQTGASIGDLSFYHEELGRFTYSNKSTVAWSPNGAHVAESGNTQVIVWGNYPVVCQSDQCAQDGGDHSDLVSQLAWSPDSKYIASAGLDKTVVVYDLANKTNHAVYKGHTSSVNAVAWSPNGKLIASGAADGSVHIWDPNTANALAILYLHNQAVTSLAWSPDSTRLAIASLDGTVTLWDLIHYAVLLTYRAHIGAVISIAWSPGGTHLASAGSDKLVRVWNASTGNTTFIYKGHTDEVRAVAWSPDSTRIASASRDGTLQLWSPT